MEAVNGVTDVAVAASDQPVECESEYVPLTLAQCLALDPSKLGEEIYQFTIDFKDAVEESLTATQWEMVSKLVSSVELEATQYWEERERLWMAALAERFPLIAPALRCMRAHFHTTDLGETPWNCPGGECRSLGWPALREHLDHVLERAPSFEILDALTRRLPSSDGVPADVQAAFERHRAGMARHAELRLSLVGLLSKQTHQVVNAREREDGHLWSSEYTVFIELLIAHMPGLGPVLRLMWEHVRDDGYPALMAGRFCCAGVEPTA